MKTSGLEKYTGAFILVAILSSAASAADRVVMEDWWYPLRFESVQNISDARYHFRRNEEKSAADDLRRVESWLRYAAERSTPNEKDSVNEIAMTIRKLAENIDMGQIIEAATMDKAMASASMALARWNYLKATDELAKMEISRAVQNLEAAAMHLQSAADSAHAQFGPDEVLTFQTIRESGQAISLNQKVDNNGISKNLAAIKQSIEKLQNTLRDAPASQ